MPEPNRLPDKIPMTRAGYEKLRTELDHMREVEMPAVTQRVADARAEGDLKENAEYHGARETQGMLQARINALADKLSRATITNTTHSPQDKVAFGATVKIKDLDYDEEEVYTLVGAGEEDYDAGRIPMTAPLAKGLAGKKVGDIVEMPAPRKTLRFEILQITYE